MNIDEFLDREIKILGEGKGINVQDTGNIKAEVERLKLEYPDITHEVKKYLKKNDFPNQIKLALEKNDFTTSEKLYYEFWERLNENVVWDQNLHSSLIGVGTNIKEALNQLQLDVNKKQVLAKNLILKAKENIIQGNHQLALSLYSELTDLHNEIPSFLYEEKRKMHNDILNLYMSLKEKIDYIFLFKFNASLNQIRHMMGKAKLNLKYLQLNKAKDTYLGIVKIYTSLPMGFLSEKINMSKDILELYKEISISLEIKDLESQLGIGRIKIKQANYPMIKKTGISTHKPFVPKHIPTSKIKLKVNKFETITVKYPTIKTEKYKENPPLHSTAPKLEDETYSHDKEIEKLKEISKQLKTKFINSEELDHPTIKTEKYKENLPLHSTAPKLEDETYSHDKEIEKLKEISKQLKTKFINSEELDHPIFKKTGISTHKPFVSEYIPASNIKLKFHKSDELKKLSAKPKSSKEIDLKNLLIKRRLERAKLKMHKGNYDDAKKDFESVLRIDPDNKKASNMLNKVGNK